MKLPRPLREGRSHLSDGRKLAEDIAAEFARMGRRGRRAF